MVTPRIAHVHSSNIPHRGILGVTVRFQTLDNGVMGLYTGKQILLDPYLSTAE